MRMSQLFGRTLKQAPQTSSPSRGLAERAAIVSQLEGQSAWLPLGERVLQKVVNSLQEIRKDTQGVIAPPGSVDAGWMPLLQSVIQSYRQLPVNLSAIRWVSAPPQEQVGQSVWQRALQRVAVFSDPEDHAAAGEQWFTRIEAWSSSLGVSFLRSDWLLEEKGLVHLHPHGEKDFLLCPSCGYAARADAARSQVEPLEDEPLEELSPVATPGTKTIKELAAFLQVPESKTLKAVFLTSEDERLVFVVLRGDLELSTSKLAHTLGSRSLQPADEMHIQLAGAQPGFAGPVGMQVQDMEGGEGILVVGDLSIEKGMNFVAGANRPDHHLTGVNYPRDFQVSILADVAEARPGDLCVQCGSPLVAQRGSRLSSWHKLDLPLHYSAKDGGNRAALISVGTLYLTPILDALIDRYADENGIGWPAQLAPYDIHIVELKCPQEAADVSRRLEEAGWQILHDDRDISAGVKFKDADLIGCPIRVTVSHRSLDQGGIEVMLRGTDTREIVPIGKLTGRLKALWDTLM
jgi:prolyl-tRNA synthetase